MTYGILLAIRNWCNLTNSAPDYDDWSTKAEWGPGLNGDILLRYSLNGNPSKAFEISSMGIRVDEDSLKRQLTLLGLESRMLMPWHKKLLSGKLPYSVGGGIGQSRLCMFLLHKVDHNTLCYVTYLQSNTLEKCNPVYGLRKWCKNANSAV